MDSDYILEIVILNDMHKSNIGRIFYQYSRDPELADSSRELRGLSFNIHISEKELLEQIEKIYYTSQKAPHKISNIEIKRTENLIPFIAYIYEKNK